MIIPNQHEELYMCLTDFEWELGMAQGGNVVYGTVEDLKKHRKCVDGCGIVKVRVELVEVIQEPNYEKSD